MSAEAFTFGDSPRPFKHHGLTHQKPGTKAFMGNKRNKNVKQILALERERLEKVKGTVSSEEFVNIPTYSSVVGPPSLKPAKKYCDITGLKAPYIDPKSTLRYHNVEIYEVIKTCQPSVIQAYLGLRGQGVVLR